MYLLAFQVCFTPYHNNVWARPLLSVAIKAFYLYKQKTPNEIKTKTKVTLQKKN